MDKLSTKIQANIADGHRIVEALLSGQQALFPGPTVEVSDEGGIYAFSDRRTGEVLYVGQSTVGISSRMKDHWAGTASSDLARKLVTEGIVENIPEGREWIRDNVAVHWMTRNEFDTCIRWAEHFAIAVLRPKFNK